jgi:hypothetical protein
METYALNTKASYQQSKLMRLAVYRAASRRGKALFQLLLQVIWLNIRNVRYLYGWKNTGVRLGPLYVRMPWFNPPIYGSEMWAVVYGKCRRNCSNEQRMLDLKLGITNFMLSAIGLVVVDPVVGDPDTETVPWWIIQMPYQRRLISDIEQQSGWKVGLVDTLGRGYAREKRLERWRRDQRLAKANRQVAKNGNIS